MNPDVWKNEKGRLCLESWFERFSSSIPAPVDFRQVSTRFGSTHVLIAGQTSGQTIVCLHAMRTGSAHLVSELGPLLEHFRIIAPDLPRQSVRGLAVPLPLTDDAHARWLLDIADGLGLESFDLFGVSWGGFVARLTASTAPHRVRRLGLLVPAGIANGSHWRGLTQMAIPLLRYQLSPSEKNLRRFLDPILTTWDADWGHYMGDTVRHMKFDLRIPPLATDTELKRLTMPVLALGAADDISFPGAAVVERIRSQVPHAEGEIIPSCKHCPPTTPEFRHWLAERLTRFYQKPI